jgi:hypothetical protein
MTAAGRTSSGWMIGVTVAFLLGSTGCADRMTPARAATILRHSNAFLSGAPESDPVLDGVSSVATEPAAGGREADQCLVVFTYHWPPTRGATAAGQLALPLTASAYLRRSGAAWAVDDARSRTLTPTWPRLPRTPRPF